MSKHQIAAKCTSLPASFCLVLLLTFAAECTASSRLLVEQSPVTTTSTTAAAATAPQPADHIIGTVGTSTTTVGPAHKPAVSSITTTASTAIPTSPDHQSSALNGATVAASGAKQPLTFFMHDIPYVAGFNCPSLTTSLNTATPLNGLNNNNNNDDDNENSMNINNNLVGTTTVIDGELTEGLKTGSSVIGRAQGFYIPSSQDGTSQSLMLTATFEGDGEYADTLSFFGVYRNAAPESRIVVVGGTGKYESAKGFAVIQTMQPAEEQTDESVGTLLQFTLHLY